MKKLLLFLLFPLLSFAQINIDGVCSYTKKEAKAYGDEIISLAPQKFRFYKIVQQRESEIFVYVPVNLTDEQIGAGPQDYTSYETIEIIFSIYMDGKNEDLKIDGVKTYRLERAHGQFLNLFPFWQKYYVPDATSQNYKEYQKKEFRKGRLFMKFVDNDEGNWYITPFYCG